MKDYILLMFCDLSMLPSKIDCSREEFWGNAWVERFDVELEKLSWGLLRKVAEPSIRTLLNIARRELILDWQGMFGLSRIDEWTTQSTILCFINQKCLGEGIEDVNSVPLRKPALPNNHQGNSTSGRKFWIDANIGMPIFCKTGSHSKKTGEEIFEWKNLWICMLQIFE